LDWVVEGGADFVSFLVGVIVVFLLLLVVVGVVGVMFLAFLTTAAAVMMMIPSFFHSRFLLMTITAVALPPAPREEGEREENAYPPASSSRCVPSQRVCGFRAEEDSLSFSLVVVIGGRLGIPREQQLQSLLRRNDVHALRDLEA